MHSKGARTHENDPIPWCACTPGAREFKCAHFWSSLYTCILRDHLELVTTGFLHSFVANLGSTLQLKMALGLMGDNSIIKVTKRIEWGQKSKPKNPPDKKISAKKSHAQILSRENVPLYN